MPTLQVLRSYCVRDSMEVGMGHFVRQCIYCMDSMAGQLKTRPLGELLHGERVAEVIHVGFIHIGTGGPLRKNGVRNVARKCLLVIVEDISGYVGLEPAAVCTTAVTAAETLLRWGVVVEMLQVWASDTERHFNNRALRLVAEALGMPHRFAVVNSPWTNGMLEGILREIVRTFKPIINQNRRPLVEWVRLVLVVQWALDAACFDRYKACPYKLVSTVSRGRRSRRWRPLRRMTGR